MLANQIWQCLDLDLLDGAEVLAEQLVASADGGGSRYLLGRVLSRRGQFESVRRLVKAHTRTHLGCAWLYARACLKLDEQSDGAALLNGIRALWALDNDLPLDAEHSRSELTPAAFHLLLAELSSGQNAQRELTASTRLDPYLVENVFALCRAATAEVKGKHMFSRVDEKNATGPSSLHSSLYEEALPTIGAPLGAPLGATGGGGAGAPGTLGATLGTPSVGGAPQASTPRRIATPRALNTPMTFGLPSTFGPPSGHAPSLHAPSVHAPSLQAPSIQAPSIHAPSIHVPRRRERSFFREHSSMQSIGRGLFDASIPGPSVADTLETLVDALELLSQCEFAGALALIEMLAAPVRETPFVLALRARLLLEQGKYDACADLFGALRQQQPDRARDMELYSTALWHLRREPALALLAFELTHRGAAPRRSWQSWCALGNAFSLRHDSANAIKCFERALVIKPTAYAHTLLGYEFMATDELSRATDAFSRALACSPQHFNAWYGLATACYSLGYLADAEAHCMQALHLNPNNGVLHCFLGAVLAERGAMANAIIALDRACVLDPKSATPRVRKADALAQLGRDEEALRLLLEVEQLAPEDAEVQLELGELYKRLGEGESAVQHFTKAHQLDPRRGVKIRKMLENI